MVTIKDVARLAGVSPSTASRAMHDHQRISEATKERVRQAMKALDYSPNFSAQNLVKRHSQTVGVILPVKESERALGDNPFFMQIIQGITSACSDANYMVSLATGQDEATLIKNIQTLIRSGNIRKFIFAYAKADDAVIKFVQAQLDVTCVVVGHAYDSDKTCFKFVDNDNYQAGYDVADFLFEKGYQQLIYVYNNLDELVQLDRYVGCMDSSKAHGNHLDTLYLTENQEKNLKNLSSLLVKYSDNVAFVASDDILAIRLQQLLEIDNIHIKNYGLLGFNNSIIARIGHPAITSVEVFPYQLGFEAANLLLSDDETDRKSVV